jgi:hypothetical protein
MNIFNTFLTSMLRRFTVKLTNNLLPMNCLLVCVSVLQADAGEWWVCGIFAQITRLIRRGESCETAAQQGGKRNGQILDPITFAASDRLSIRFFPPCCAAVLQLRDTFDEELFARLRFEN